MRQQREFDPARVQAFAYDGWDADDRGAVTLRYRLDDRRFEERFTFALDAEPVDRAGFEHALTLLHMCAGTSYYKAAAPPVVTDVPDWAAPFVRDLYLHGLAEFAMANGLDPIRPELHTVPGGRCRPPQRKSGPRTPSLVAVGGGKDSIVTIESVGRAGHDVELASVRTHPAIEATAAVSGRRLRVVDRVLDPRLLELNEHGARNGHVPVTAINSAALAALGVAIGASAVVMSNESSASVPMAEHRGLAVNHQWSKGLDFERTFAALAPVAYFSLLRPLHEVEIGRRFAGLDRYFDVVTSCNVAYTAQGRAAGVRWCGQCPKCRFVFLALAPFLPPESLRRVFGGADPLADASGADGYRAILGLAGPPPMECVGTTRESCWAMATLGEDPAWRDRPVVRALAASARAVVESGWDPLAERGPHAIPVEWQDAADALA
jgi:hypothetical protein